MSTGEEWAKDYNVRCFSQKMFLICLNEIEETSIGREWFGVGSLLAFACSIFIHGESRTTLFILGLWWSLTSCYAFGKAFAYRKLAKLVREHMLYNMGIQLHKSGDFIHWENGTPLNEDWKVKELLKLKS